MNKLESAHIFPYYRRMPPLPDPVPIELRTPDAPDGNTVTRALLCCCLLALQTTSALAQTDSFDACVLDLIKNAAGDVTVGEIRQTWPGCTGNGCPRQSAGRSGGA
jgi:hypothetical protein